MAKSHTSTLNARRALLGACLSCASAAAVGPPAAPQLGHPADPVAVARTNLSIYPDGRGLPPGGATAAQGRPVYEARCARCHGRQGEGGSGGAVSGRDDLTDPDPDQTVGNYWPYATTLFDYIRRAMPMDAPATLSNDEIYAVSAYLLYLNKIIPLDQVIDATTLPRIRMPNRDGFIGIDAPLPKPAAAGSRR